MQANQLKLPFVNSIKEFGLPIHENVERKTAQIKGYNYSKTPPTPLSNVKLVSHSEPCTNWITGLKENFADASIAEYLCGNKLFEGSDPLAHCYCGHQFGHFSGQLGDGRAISLGDVQTNHQISEEQASKFGTKLYNKVDLQIKGGGLTPYSRTADGRAVLRSSIREYLCSEAMWSLGIATTRAASLVVSEDTVKRDKLYTGNVINERCAVVMRIAPTFMRFGSFEIFKPTDSYTGRAGPSTGLKEKMAPDMLNYLLKNFYEEIDQIAQDDKQKYQMMFEKIVVETAEMAALWQCYGFCHGVLNTDNMSLLSLTIDYGPYAWMENFDPNFICNHSDQDRGRYKYKAQGDICEWNLYRLAEALDPVLDLEGSTDAIKNLYKKQFKSIYEMKMAQKLGILLTQAPEGGRLDLGVKLVRINPTQEFRSLTRKEVECIESLMDTMAQTASDFTDTFRLLAEVEVGVTAEAQTVLDKLVKISAPQKFFEKQVGESRLDVGQIMQLKMIVEQKPQILPMLGLSLEQAQKEIENFEAFQKMLDRSDEDKAKEHAERVEKYKRFWTRWLGQYLSVLEETVEFKEMGKEAYLAARRESMNKRCNPLFILRNYLMEDAIKDAETKDDFTKMNDLLKRAMEPFDDVEQVVVDWRPDSRFDICISCSS